MSHLNEASNFTPYFSFFLNIQISDFMTIRLERGGFFNGDRRTERQTNITNLIVAFRYFANTPEKIYIITLSFLSALLWLSVHSAPKSYVCGYSHQPHFNVKTKLHKFRVLHKKKNFVFLNFWIIKWLHVFIHTKRACLKSVPSKTIFVVSLRNTLILEHHLT